MSQKKFRPLVDPPPQPYIQDPCSTTPLLISSFLFSLTQITTNLQFGFFLMQLGDEDLKQIEAIMAHTWEVDTHTTYVSCLLSFMVFCDKKGIPEEDRASVSHILLLSFVSALTVAYSGSAISNYLYGIQVWHILHGIPWKIEKLEMDTLLKAAEKVTPPSSRQKKRRPYTIDFILSIWQHLDLQKPLNSAVFACLTTCFFATGHIGEFMVPKLDGFNPEAHVSKTRLSYDQSREGLKVTVLHIP